MQASNPDTEVSRYVVISDHPCPQCGGQLMRIRRRSIDRMFSWFLPVHRFRCARFSCQWEGNYRAVKTSPVVLGHMSSVPNPVPVSFMVTIALVVAGVVLVVLVAVTEFYVNTPAEVQEISHSQMRSAPAIMSPRPRGMVSP